MTPGKDRQEVADLPLAGERVREGQMGMDGVAVAAPAARARDVSRGGELGDDAVRSTFGDPNPLADLAQADAWVFRDAEERLRVVREKRPWGPAVVSHANKNTVSRLRSDV